MASQEVKFELDFRFDFQKVKTQGYIHTKPIVKNFTAELVYAIYDSVDNLSVSHFTQKHGRTIIT